MHRYVAEAVKDDLMALKQKLAEIAADNGRVANVFWQPERNRQTEVGPFPLPAGYVIIVEYEL